MSVLPVTVIITTYDRGDGARFDLLYQTIQGLRENLTYPELRWIVTDDGSVNHDEMVEDVKFLLPDRDVIFFNTERKGVGYAKNNSIREAFNTSHIYFLLEDDWYLAQPFQLVKYVQLMLDHSDIGIFRFGYVGGTTLEAYYRGYDPFNTFWEFKRGTDVYAYSGQVSLRSKIWNDTVGWHKENCTASEEELAMCIAYNATENAPKILWDANYGTTLNAGPFKNIGLGNSVAGDKP